MNVCLSVWLYSIDPITAKFWEIIRCIPGKVFVNFQNPRVYH